MRIERGNIGYGIRPTARSRGLATVVLRLALDRARNFGLSEVLVTCGKGNIASARIIRRNGGVLESEDYLDSRGEIVQRYIITIANSVQA